VQEAEVERDVDDPGEAPDHRDLGEHPAHPALVQDVRRHVHEVARQPQRDRPAERGAAQEQQRHHHRAEHRLQQVDQDAAGGQRDRRLHRQRGRAEQQGAGQPAVHVPPEG
jgi:hypothetical protein